jgi:hypothetical protein
MEDMARTYGQETAKKLAADIKHVTEKELSLTDIVIPMAIHGYYYMVGFKNNKLIVALPRKDKSDVDYDPVIEYGLVSCVYDFFKRLEKLNKLLLDGYVTTTIKLTAETDWGKMWFKYITLGLEKAPSQIPDNNAIVTPAVVYDVNSLSNVLADMLVARTLNKVLSKSMEITNAVTGKQETVTVNNQIVPVSLYGSLTHNVHQGKSNITRLTIKTNIDVVSGMSYYSAFSNLNKDITTLGKAIEDFNFDAVGYGARSDLWRTLSKTITTYIHDTDNGKLNAENRDMILQIIKTVGDRTDDHSARLLVHFMGKIETLPKVISGYSRLLYDILGRGYGISSPKGHTRPLD